MSGERGRLILLGGLATLGSLAIQIVVPALPALSEGIGASAAGGQLVISVYLIGLAISQLVWAPVSDRYGRRPVMLWGVAIFLIGTLGCAMADNLALMLGGRLIQAVGASASLVTARAMATDRAPAGTSAGPLATLTSVTLVSPAAAPAIGGLLAGVGGWRSLFWLLAILTIVAGIFAARLLGESRRGDNQPLHPGRMARNYWHVAGQPGYLPLALSNGFINGGFYLFLAVSPFILDAAGATPALAGLFYSAVACAIIGGSLAVPLVMRHWPARLTSIGSVILGIGAFCIVAVAVTGANLPGLFVAMSLIAFGAGVTGPTLLAEAIERQRGQASSATSLFGAIQMIAAALISTAAVRLVTDPTVQLALTGLIVQLAILLRLKGGRTASR